MTTTTTAATTPETSGCAASAATETAQATTITVATETTISSSNALTEQQRRLLKRPSSSPSRRKRSDPINMAEEKEELPSTSKESKQMKRESADIVPNNAMANVQDVVDHVAVAVAATTTHAITNNSQQPLINSTCDKIETPDAQTTTVATTTTATPANSTITNAIPAATSTIADPISNFAGYLQNVELAEGAYIITDLICFMFILKISCSLDTKATDNVATEATATASTTTNSHDFVFADTIDHGKLLLTI